MSKEDAIEYLKYKNEIGGREVFDLKDKAKIKKVMREGKIYGDPLIIVKQ